MNAIDMKKMLLNAFERKIDINDKDVLIFGAGNASYYNKSFFEREKINVTAFIDSNPKKVGKSFMGKKIISFDDINIYKKPIIFVSALTISRVEMKKMIDNAKFENYYIDELIFTHKFNEFMETFDLWEDDKSKEVYVDMILTRIGRKNVNPDLISTDKYYALNEFKISQNNEIFVDCGAYVGDTIEDYIKIREGVFGEIYAFEPYIRNFDAMKYRVERINREWGLPEKKINLVNAGVGKNKVKMNLNNVDTAGLSMSFSGEASDDGIDVYALDDYFSEKKVSFIKADIEGYEERMINGAEKIIKRDKPIMAICVYHSFSDMYRIPLLLKELNPDYKFSLRQHGGYICETVLYVY